MRSKLLFLMLVAVILPASALGHGDENLLENPSFEDGTYARDSNPDYWHRYSGTGFWETVGSAEGVASDGDKFVLLDSSGSSFSSTAVSQNLLPAITIDPAKEYYLSVMAKDSPTVAGTGTLDFWVYWYDIPWPDDTQGDWSEDVPMFTTTATWERYTFGPYTPPAWAGTARPRIYSYDASEGYYTGRTAGILVDDVYFGTDPPTGHPVHTPTPADDSSVAPSTTTLSWIKEQECPTPIQCELWWGRAAADDDNFWSESDKIMNLADVTSFNLANAITGAITLTADEEYFWALKYEDDNECAFGAGLLEGDVWSFGTSNDAPVVDAGLNQSVWLSGGTASVYLNGSATDDGLPDPPDTLTYLWLPVAGVSFDNDTDPATTANFTALGTYTLTLEVKDDKDNVSSGLGKTSSGTVEIYVYAQAYSGLVANWQFENDYDDSVGGHTGTPQGDPQFVGDAVQGSYSLEFDGNGDYVDCGGGVPDPNYITQTYPPTWASPLDPTKMTVTCWMKTDGFTSGGWGNLVSKGEYAWQLSQTGTSNDAEFDVYNYGVITSADGPAIPQVDDDKWHHIAGVIAGNASYFYVDGVLVDSQIGGPPGPGGHSLWIGKGYYPSFPSYTCEFKGKIDDVKLYDCPLTHEKIIDEYILGGGSNSCGGKYAIADVNQDCYVTLADFAAFAGRYLWCNDIVGIGCE